MRIYNKLKEITKLVFSVGDYGNTHKIIKMFGIKLKFPKPEFAKIKKENLFYYYKKNNVDITTLPPATGQIRDIQLANLALLNELDYVCKSAGLKYWLDGGTLLGAVRHKGFIPWDDDIDTAMQREDYEQIIDAFKKYSRNTDIFADYVRDSKKHSVYLIKVLHKKCPHLFVDIFPWDSYKKKLSKKEQLEITNLIKKARKELHCATSFKTSDVELNKKIKSTMQKLYLPKEEEESDFVWGMEFNHIWENWFTSYNVVYPLKTIEFEGGIYPCLNKPDEFLKRVYKDYMSYPKEIGFGHSVYLKINKEEQNIIERLKNER